MKIHSVCLVATLVACASTPPTEAEIAAPPIHTEPDRSDQLIEIRSTTVAWEGAEGASRRISRDERSAEIRAQTVAALARQPDSNFGEVARAYGDTPPAIQRIERGAEGVDPRVARVAFRLHVGDIGGPIRTERGFVVFERRPDPQVGPSQVGARHILIAHEGAARASEEITRSADEARIRAGEVAERVRAGEEWDELHARYSDEPGNPGGDLGTFGRGDMTPAFERAVWGMEIGQTSDPVQTPFGYHVIQRTR